MRGWQLQEAKAQFSQVVRIAQETGPQLVSIRGKPAVVIISKSQFDKLKNAHKNLVAFLNASPLKGVHFQIKRNNSLAKKAETISQPHRRCGRG